MLQDIPRRPITSLVDIENELKRITAELDFNTPAPDRCRAALEQDILSSTAVVSAGARNLAAALLRFGYMLTFKFVFAHVIRSTEYDEY